MRKAGMTNRFVFKSLFSRKRTTLTYYEALKRQNLKEIFLGLEFLSES